MKFIEHHRKGRSLIFNGKTKTWQVILFCLPAHDYDLISSSPSTHRRQ